MKFRSRLSIVAVMMVLATVGAPAGVARAEGQNGTTLSADVAASGYRQYDWTIEKTAVPAAWDLFKGDTGTSRYTINVTKSTEPTRGFIEGQVCVTNGGEVATEGLGINLRVMMPPNTFVQGPLAVDVSAAPVLNPGATSCYPYNIEVTGFLLDATYKVTADITITNHSGYLTEPFGPSPSATTQLTGIRMDSVNVDDSNGGTWLFDKSDSVSYPQTFACDGDAGLHENTATIRETGLAASAAVSVACNGLIVDKSAQTSYTRTYHWGITKTADRSAMTLALGQQMPVNYQVTVSMTGTEGSDFAVEGAIDVRNPSALTATINSVADDLSGYGAIAPNCGLAPMVLGAFDILTCHYGPVALPDMTPRTNTATAFLQNYNFGPDGSATPGNTTAFSGTAEVTFGEPTTEIDRCVDVIDSQAGHLGTVCAEEGTKTFSYSVLIGGYDACGLKDVPNTATVNTLGGGFLASADWDVQVSVPCSGCTLTLGYWKNHADDLAKNLPVWLGIAGGAQSVFVTSVDQATQYLRMNGDASNGINKLYAQLLAARLDVKNGADGSAVSAAMAAADGFLADHTADDWYTLSRADRAAVNQWGTTLDAFNNGLIGPGHCSE